MTKRPAKRSRGSVEPPQKTKTNQVGSDEDCRSNKRSKATSCKCGSTTHFRTGHSDCPLKKSNQTANQSAAAATGDLSDDDLPLTRLLLVGQPTKRATVVAKGICGSLMTALMTAKSLTAVSPLSCSSLVACRRV